MLDNAFRGGRRYWILLGVWVLLVIVGLAAYARQFTEGLRVTGLSRDVSWGLYIAQFTFMVGVAASPIMILLPCYLHKDRDFARMVILAEFLAVAAVVTCMLFIFVDLGRPMRVMNVILHPNPTSLMFWDMCTLSGYLVLSLVIAVVALEADRRGMPAPRWFKPLVVLAIPWAVGIHTVTAFLYAGLSARPSWMTAILAPRFLASEFASGPAMLILLALIVRRFTRLDPGRGAIGKLAVIVTYALILNVFFVLLELFTGLYSGLPEHAATYRYLYVGLAGHHALVGWMWACAALTVGCAVLLLIPKLRRNDVVLGWLCVGVIAAIWIEKGLAIVPAGFIPSPLGAVHDYVPTLTEIAITVGVYAVGGLIVTVLYKMVVNVKERSLAASQPAASRLSALSADAKTA